MAVMAKIAATAVLTFKYLDMMFTLSSVALESTASDSAWRLSGRLAGKRQLISPFSPRDDQANKNQYRRILPELPVSWARRRFASQHVSPARVKTYPA
jgi:hypothetical protein